MRDVEVFADFLLEKYGVLVATVGNYEGCSGSFLRIPLGYPQDTIRRAIQLIRSALIEWIDRKGQEMEAAS